MKKLMRTFVFFISLMLIGQLTAQNTDSTATKKLKQNNSYGLRVGVDINKIVRTISSSDYSGFEINGDYRLTKKYYAAAEIGAEKIAINETSVSTTAQGSFIKAGVDYNAHKNLVGMRNLIFVGLHYGFATFDQELNNFSIATRNSFFENPQRTSNLSNNGLTAHWAEFLAGIKAEVLNNLFLGFNVSVRFMITEQQPDGFDSAFIPGFGTTSDFSQVGTGFTYFISYYIPLYKKKNGSKKKKDSTQKSE
ncbi:DUF6048 family protein [Aquimarina agarivorans]|uniref:DUF6048 family protein n=1 Tax=Aquimarina agarivorans TaxID=980584 RepID=UPI001EE63946|nr:DUF6048 family protein [Aquimarina agarivorans]